MRNLQNLYLYDNNFSDSGTCELIRNFCNVPNLIRFFAYGNNRNPKQ